jgi:hypothetical protein
MFLRSIVILAFLTAGSQALAQWEVKTTELAEGPHALSGRSSGGAISGIGVYCGDGRPILTVSDFAGMQSAPHSVRIGVDGSTFALDLPHY